jgi:plasmid maintenance system killer protein
MLFHIKFVDGQHFRITLSNLDIVHHEMNTKIVKVPPSNHINYNETQDDSKQMFSVRMPHHIHYHFDLPMCNETLY